MTSPGRVRPVDRILVRGVRARGIHGVLPQEHRRPQPFAVDVELDLDLSTAARSDDLADTVDYAGVIDMVVRVIEGEHHELLEALAARIAEGCRSDPRVDRVTVTVRKLRPPLSAVLDHVAVCITR